MGLYYRGVWVGIATDLNDPNKAEETFLAKGVSRREVGLLHFVLGYSLFGGLEPRSWLIGLFFALTFAAGHLNQEVRDYEGDRQDGIQTNGVRFGKRRTFWAGFVLFTLCYGYLFVLASSGLIPPPLRYLTVLYPIHAVLFWRTLQVGLTFEHVSRLQARYRILYAVIGLSMAATVLLTSSAAAP